MPAPINRIRIGIRVRTGRRMTKSASLNHSPSPSVSCFIPKGTLKRLTFSPRIANIAIKNVVEKNTARATARAPPMPMEGRPVPSKNSMPVNPITTVIPLKNTAFPAVALVIASASRLS